MRRRPIDIIIPVHRNAHLAEALLKSLRNCREEIERLDARIIVANDSPSDADTAAFIAATENEGAFPKLTIIRNERCRGFVQTANKAFAVSISSRRDVLLLNSDTQVFPGALDSIVDVAYRDPRIGFVSPRSNNAAIFSLPHQEELRSSDPQCAHRDFMSLTARLPLLQYMPTAIGFCLFIKLEVLEEVGVFDEVFGFGYQEENDLIMRARRFGYMAAAANRAFVFHVGGASTTAANLPKMELDARNAKIIKERYPSFFVSVDTFCSGPRYRAEFLQAGFLPDPEGRLTIVVDGDPEQLQALRRAEAWNDFQFCDAAAWNDVPSPAQRQAPTAVIHLAEPRDWRTLLWTARTAPINIFVLMDDSPRSDVPDAREIRSFLFEFADAVIYRTEGLRAHCASLFHKRPGLLEIALDSESQAEGSVPAAASPSRWASLLKEVLHSAMRAHSIDHVLIPRLTAIERIEQRVVANMRLDASERQVAGLTEKTAWLESQLQTALEELSKKERVAARAFEDAARAWKDLSETRHSLQQRIAELESSVSWRLTSPLRAVMRLIVKRAPGHESDGSES